MAELSEEEKQYNQWWLSRFDAKKFKTIRLFKNGRKIKTYTTANKDYTDIEDAESAFWTASKLGLNVDCVWIDKIRFKIRHGKLCEVKQ